MNSVVENYRQRMTRLNRRFLKNRICDINKRALENERKKLDLMARFWFHLTRWPQPGSSTWPDTSSDRARQAYREEAITRLEEVAELYHPHMDGLQPPSLSSDAAIEAIAEAIEETSHEKYLSDGGTDPISFKIPNELKSFLKYADGIKDPDFRYEGMCSWTIPAVPLIPDHTDYTNNAAIKSAARQTLKCLTVDFHNGSRPFPYDILSEDLDMKVGFYCGEATKQDQNKWSSYYLFCRRHDNTGEESEQGGWAWRPVFWCLSDAIEYLDMDLPVFDTIAELLRWYSGWYRRLDVERLRHDMLDDKGTASEIFLTEDGVYSEGEFDEIDD